MTTGMPKVQWALWDGFLLEIQILHHLQLSLAELEAKITLIRSMSVSTQRIQ